MPRSIRGRMTRDVERWNLSARANIEFENLEDIDFGIYASTNQSMLPRDLKLLVAIASLCLGFQIF